jgi:hypothetical protein
MLDTALIQTEERLGIDACLEGYEWLERLGVIRRTWSGWVIEHFDEHHGPVGMNAAAMAVLARHLETADEPTLVAVPVREPEREMAPVVTLKPWRRRLPVVAASVAAGVAVLAGATQFVPQAAVTGRNAAVQTNGTDAVSPASGPITSALTNVTGAPTSEATSALGGPDASVATTTTSTTLLPGLPCLSETLNDLTTGAKLGGKTTVLPPGVLPCP